MSDPDFLRHALLDSDEENDLPQLNNKTESTDADEIQNRRLYYYYLIIFLIALMINVNNIKKKSICLTV